MGSNRATSRNVIILRRVQVPSVAPLGCAPTPRRLHRFSSKLCEAESGQTFGRPPLRTSGHSPEPPRRPPTESPAPTRRQCVRRRPSGRMAARPPAGPRHARRPPTRSSRPSHKNADKATTRCCLTSDPESISFRHPKHSNVAGITPTVFEIGPKSAEFATTLAEIQADPGPKLADIGRVPYNLGRHAMAIAGRVWQIQRRCRTLHKLSRIRVSRGWPSSAEFGRCPSYSPQGWPKACHIRPTIGPHRPMLTRKRPNVARQ